MPSSNLQEKDWSKLSSPNPSAKSRFAAERPEPQVENAVLDATREFAENIQLDIESEQEIEFEPEAIAVDLESNDQIIESDLPEQEFEQNLSEDADEELAGDVSDVELIAESSETNVDQSEIVQPEENEAVEGEAGVSAEQNQIDTDHQSEIVESEISKAEIAELIGIQENEDSDVSLVIPAMHLSEVELETASDSSTDATMILPTEIALSSEQPIAEFVSHKLINMEIKHIVEAALFASGSAMSVSRLYRVFDEDERPERSEIRAALTILQQDYADKAVQLVEVAGGFRFQVKADYASWIARLFEERPPKYSRALLETLSIIAYRQPVTRGDIENIRGVSVSTQIIQTLQEREWVKIVGHKEVPGKPALFATTAAFLDYFNLKSLTDLPPLSEFIIPDEIPEQPQDTSTEDEIDQQAEENQINQTQSVASDTSSD
ncbi:MAG: SMC-Scp complex subunit ScpB [Methylococcales bacterium]